VSKIISKNNSPVQSEEQKFNTKEIGYLLKCLEDGHHNGQVLELALACKLKLNNVLKKLINKQEAI